MAKNGKTTPMDDASAPKAGPDASQMDPEMIAKVAELRGRLQTSIAQVVLAMATAPRYRHIPLKDVSEMILEPMLRDRIAVATPDPKTASALDKDTLAGVAIWATVSDEVDENIREQISEGVFPIRLKPDDWTSGETTWLLDVIAPSKDASTAVLRNFAAYVKKGPMKLHPMVGRVVNMDDLKKMGAASEDAAPQAAES